MSYSISVCNGCGGEYRLFVEGDGSAYGKCPQCGKIHNYTGKTEEYRVTGYTVLCTYSCDDCFDQWQRTFATKEEALAYEKQVWKEDRSQSTTFQLIEEQEVVE